MDGHRFDSATRALARVLSRRQSLRALLIVVAGSNLTTAGSDAAVRRRTCRPLAAGCVRNSDCCTGTCDTRRTTPRNKRNRCICIPNCDGKTCGSDGCGGLCGPDGSYGCYTGETCGEDGVTCETACSHVDAPIDPLTCEASTEYDSWSAHVAWDFFDAQRCDTAADCPTPGLCDVGGYECMCRRAWRTSDGYNRFEEEQGMCSVIRTTASACDAGPFTGPAGPECSETIEGEQFRHWGWEYWQGSDNTCESDEACIALDPACTADLTNSRCICQIALWDSQLNVSMAYGRGFCRKVSLTD